MSENARPTLRPRLFSVGHSNRTAAAFVEVLAAHSIATLCDVRRYPASKRHPQFDRPELGALLDDAGVGYLWLGDALGGYRDYDEHMGTPLFRDGVAALLAAGRARPTVFMCAEKDVAHCHRRHIADHLVRDHRVIVTHILDADTTAPHRPQTTLF